MYFEINYTTRPAQLMSHILFQVSNAAAVSPQTPKVFENSDGFNNITSLISFSNFVNPIVNSSSTLRITGTSVSSEVSSLVGSVALKQGPDIGPQAFQIPKDNITKHITSSFDRKVPHNESNNVIGSVNSSDLYHDSLDLSMLQEVKTSTLPAKPAEASIFKIDDTIQPSVLDNHQKDNSSDHLTSENVRLEPISVTTSSVSSKSEERSFSSSRKSEPRGRNFQLKLSRKYSNINRSANSSSSNNSSGTCSVSCRHGRCSEDGLTCVCDSGYSGMTCDRGESGRSVTSATVA